MRLIVGTVWQCVDGFMRLIVRTVWQCVDWVHEADSRNSVAVCGLGS